MMLAIGLSYIVFTMLRYTAFIMLRDKENIHIFFRAFIMHWCPSISFDQFKFKVYFV
jgi:hypothetical protein